MLDKLVIDEVIPDIEKVIPACYAEYRSLVRDGLKFFLSRLSPERRVSLFAQQACMPETATIEERVVAVLRSCPTLHKLGQVVARDPRLSTDLRTQLQHLESAPSQLTIEDMIPVITAELGPRLKDLTLGDEALAEASVAVVIPFAWDGGDSGLPHEGVLKVLKPGVEDKLREELALWSLLGDYLERRRRVYGLPDLAYRELFEQVGSMLAGEVCLDKEQQHLAAAARFYADEPQVRVPRLLPFCTPRITAMERIRGTKVTKVSTLPLEARRRLGTTMVEAVITMPFFRDAASAMFHADPHAGNLWLDQEGRLVMLDWSLTFEISRSRRHALVSIILGALTLDKYQIVHALSALASEPFDRESTLDIIESGLTGIPWRRWPGFLWLVEILDRLGRAGFRFSPELSMFRKALFTIQGVLADIDPHCSLNTVTAKTGALQFVRELGPRMINFTGERGFGTHVSNWELAVLLTTSPLAVSRYWWSAYQEMLEGWRNAALPVTSA